VTDERLSGLGRRAAQGDVDAQARAAYERWRLAPGETTRAWARVIARAGAAAWTPAILDAARLAALEADLAPLEKVTPGLAARAVGFALTGRDEGLLAGLRPDDGKRLALKLSPGTVRSRPRRVFAPGAPFPAPFLLRLGALYAACAGARAPRLLPWPLDWLEALLWESAEGHPRSHGGITREGPWLAVADLEGALTLARCRAWWPVRVALHKSSWLAVVVRGMNPADAVTRAPHVVARALRDADPHARAVAIHIIVSTKVDPTPWLDAVVRLAVAPKGPSFLRARAVGCVTGAGERARAPLLAVGAASRSRKVKEAVARLVTDLPPRS
jgi:hypothetical protein